MSDDTPDKVGYRKPPREHRFQKGTSGNPKGRPRGAVSLKTDMLAELAEPMTITENGKRKKISRQRGIVKVTVTRALQGDDKSLDRALGFAEKFSADAEDHKDEPLPASDQAILDDYVARFR